jgi:phosphoribosylformimino-5-aminoimidazole carboxamide ribotide isomerase
VRSIERAHELLGAGARRVIVGSALFTDRGVHLARAEAFAAAIDADRLVAAVDARHGRVVTHGWTRALDLSSVDAVRALEPFVGAFLYTHIDTEGTMTGLPLAPVLAIQAATRRRLITAGGIRSMTEVDALDRLGIDAVVGMAIYTGALSEKRPLLDMKD